MADEELQSVDVWGVLEEAEQTVEAWPSWQQRYEADLNYDEGPGSRGTASASPPAGEHPRG